MHDLPTPSCSLSPTPSRTRVHVTTGGKGISQAGADVAVAVRLEHNVALCDCRGAGLAGHDVNSLLANVRQPVVARHVGVPLHRHLDATWTPRQHMLDKHQTSGKVPFPEPYIKTSLSSVPVRSTKLIPEAGIEALSSYGISTALATSYLFQS